MDLLLKITNIGISKTKQRNNRSPFRERYPNCGNSKMPRYIRYGFDFSLITWYQWIAIFNFNLTMFFFRLYICSCWNCLARAPPAWSVPSIASIIWARICIYPRWSRRSPSTSWYAKLWWTFSTARWIIPGPWWLTKSTDRQSVNSPQSSWYSCVQLCAAGTVVY